MGWKEFRIIQHTSKQFILSLPKRLMDKLNWRKSDMVTIEEQEDSLKISNITKEQRDKKPDQTYNIENEPSQEPQKQQEQQDNMNETDNEEVSMLEPRKDGDVKVFI